ncbi:CBS domain-containing protein [candidate division KSB1 bacterium]|nr:CBS domain-containing protein [candidate division KSB1 bacterium]
MKTALDIVKNKEKDIITVTENSTIYDALKIMVQNRIGAILVTRDDKIVGVWSERDLMEDTLKEGFDPKTAIIKDYMTTNLISAPHGDSIYSLLDKFLGRRLRHLLIEKDGEYIGFLSTGDVIKANLWDKTRELKELNAIVSWEYYENWRWTGKEK